MDTLLSLRLATPLELNVMVCYLWKSRRKESWMQVGQGSLDVACVLSRPSYISKTPLLHDIVHRFLDALDTITLYSEIRSTLLSHTPF